MLYRWLTWCLKRVPSASISTTSIMTLSCSWVSATAKRCSRPWAGSSQVERHELALPGRNRLGCGGVREKGRQPAIGAQSKDYTEFAVYAPALIEALVGELVSL